MRSAILIISTLIVLAGAFAVYLWSQPSTLTVGGPPKLEVTPSTLPGEALGGIGTGEGTWVKQFDERADLVSQFRATRYDRQPDGSVKVEKPEAQFFLSRGQMLHVIGNRGNVTLQENAPARKRSPLGSDAGMPNRGELRDVTASLYEFEGAARPILTVTLDNLTFETETMRLYTEATEIAGVKVAGDQVPVQLRGEEYDLDGKGLVIRLNERDRRLELLEISHGEKLVVKNPGALGDSTKPKPASAGLGTAGSPTVKLVSDAYPAPAPAAAAQPATTQSSKSKRDDTIYRARLLKDVKIVQGPEESMIGDELQVDFFLASDKSDSPKSSPKVAPTTAPAATPPAPAAAPKSATTAPAPLIVLWTGKLSVTPAEPGAVLQKGQQVLRMLGSPVKVHQKTADVQGSKLEYETATTKLKVEGTSQFPMSMREKGGGFVESESVEYIRNQKVAVLRGKGRVSQPGEKDEVMQASWGEACRLQFAGDKEDSLEIQRAQFAGGAQILHPQMQLAADNLLLEMMPGAPSAKAANGNKRSQPELKHMLATGNVAARIKDASGKPQSIRAQKLELTTATNELKQVYPHKILADGKVKAFDSDDESKAEQKIEADRLAATLAPVPGAPSDDKTKRSLGSVKTQLADLVAERNVRVHSKDGGVVTGDELQMWLENDQLQVKLTGAPASVADKTNSVTGNQILVHGGEQWYEIQGPGAMHVIQRDEKKATTRPIDVKWEKSVDVNGTANRVDIAGNVVVRSVQSDGTLNTTQSGRVQMALRDKPVADKAATTAPKKSASTKPAKSSGLDAVATKFDAMKDKEPTVITFVDDAHLQAVQPDETGKLVMQFDLLSSTIRYDTIAERLMVPAPGKILFIDRRTPRKEKEPQQRQAVLASGGAGPGITAMRWDHELTYDQTAGRATMDGDVFVRHEPDDPKQEPFELNAKRVQVETSRKDPKDPKAKQPPGSPGIDQVSFRKLVADGGIQFSAKKIRLDADSAEYDPVNGILIVRGTDRVPGQLYDENKLSRGTFKELYWNTKTEQIDRMEDFRATVRN